MRFLFTILLCMLSIGVSAQAYSFHARTTICLLEVQSDSTEIRFNFEFSDLRWVDRSGDELQIFDGVQTLHVRGNQIVNYAGTAALKTQLNTWSVTCEE